MNQEVLEKLKDMLVKHHLNQINKILEFPKP